MILSLILTLPFLHAAIVTPNVDGENKAFDPLTGGSSALSEFRHLLGESISDEVAYAFSYPPSNFAVSNTLHSRDLPPVSWLARIIERLGIEVVGPYLPHFLNWLQSPKTDFEEKDLDDAYIATSQVAGFNPLVLRRCEDKEYLEQRFPGIFSQDNFDSEFADKRIFVSDFEVLQAINASKDNPKKQRYFPIGLFRIPPGTRQPLEVVAIKVGQKESDPVYRPGDKQWKQAKLAFISADGNYHELISHLGRTHLLIEPFVVSTSRIFLENHWIRRLLTPHFCGTASINALAFKALINEGGVIDKLLCGELNSELELSFQSIQQPGFRHLMLPTFLASRGLGDPRLLFPYRDDALSLWGAIRDWVAAFSSIHVKTDEDVAGDIYIRNWVSDLTVGGKVTDLGEVLTRDELIDVLTMVIFTASAQHAAVNYPQADQMQDARAVPFALYGDVTKDSVEEILPPKKMIDLQRQVVDLLAGLYFTKLGDYAEYGVHSYSSLEATEHHDVPLKFPNDHLVFKNETEVNALKTFRASLEQVRVVIAQRNEDCPLRQRFPYWYLHPDNIPQSINI
jgi:arachidonate 15-lipoxygenase